MKAVKTVKQVQIVATYYHKKDGKLTGVVTSLVKSSDGKSEYCTTLIDGKASGCSCDGNAKWHRKCLHMKGLEAKSAAKVVESPEQKEAREWSEYKAELAKKLAAQFMSTQVVEQIAERQNIAMELPVELKGYRKTAVSVDISTKGNLNGQQGFSVLRKVG